MAAPAHPPDLLVNSTKPAGISRSMALLMWFGKAMQSARDYVKPKIPVMTPIPSVCTVGSRVEVIKRGGREMVEGTVLRYMPSCGQAEVMFNEKGTARSELVDISTLTSQRPSDEDNISLDVLSVVDVKVEENVWYSGIIISDKGKEVRVQIPNESSDGCLFSTQVQEVTVQIFTEFAQDYCVLVDISKLRRHEYRQSDMGKKSIPKSIGIVGGQRVLVSDMVWSDRYHIVYLDLGAESNPMSEVISSRYFYKSYPSWKFLHSFYEFFHVSDMANATKLPMEFSAGALLYIALAYIPLVSSPFFDVASSLENWERYQKIFFFILGIGAIAKHVVLALVLLFSKTMTTQWMKKYKYLALCAVGESTAFLI